jgi:ABC-type sugar transport system substrate-binding protein
VIGHACSARRLSPVVALLAAMAGCQHSEEGPPAKTKEGFIAVVASDAGDPLWPILKNGAQRYGATIPTFEVKCLTPSATAPSLDDLLRSLLTEQVRALCIMTTEQRQPTALLEGIRTRGIPVISVLQSVEDQVQYAHAGYDDALIGQRLAEVTAKVIGQGTVMVLHAGRKHPVYGPRLIAFEKEMQSHAQPEVFATIDCHLDPQEAVTILRERSRRFPRLSAWVLLGDWPFRGKQPIDQLIPPTCRLITFGCPPAVWPLIRAGKCAAAVDADYGELGAQTVQLAEVGLSGQTGLQPAYRLPTRVITAAELDTWARDWQRWSGVPGTSPSTQTAPAQQARQ